LLLLLLKRHIPNSKTSSVKGGVGGLGSSSPNS
jgi:hypothetical protein